MASRLAGSSVCFRTQRGLAMCKVIMIGCDLHDATMVLKVADGPDATVRKGFATSNRSAMIECALSCLGRRLNEVHQNRHCPELRRRDRPTAGTTVAECDPPSPHTIAIANDEIVFLMTGTTE